jgi:hypothetical protein
METEWISDPLGVIESLDLDYLQDGGEVAAHSTRELDVALREGGLWRVPILTRSSLARGELPHRSLVRFRGMVQDMWEPEFFDAVWTEVNTTTGERRLRDGRYRDVVMPSNASFEVDEGAGRPRSRIPLYCVPVPGETSWATMRHDECFSSPKNGDGGKEGGAESARSSDSMTPSPLCAPKRARDEGGVDVERGCPPAAGSAPRTPCSTMPFLQEMSLAGIPCVAKLYEMDEDRIKLNDLVEFVGVLELDELSSLAPADGKEGGGECPFVSSLQELDTQLPPASLAPRLHVLWHRKFDPWQAPSSALDEPSSSPTKTAIVASLGDVCPRDAHRRIIHHISTALNGDELAAEYVLLSLASRVHARTSSFSMGSLSINITGCASGHVEALQSVVEGLVPRMVRVPLSLDTLNAEHTFSPRKDYSKGRLMMSYLQAAPGTTLLLDETCMSPGKLSACGTKNLAALESLISQQKLPYDFCFYSVDFEVDTPCITLSQGTSLLQAGVRVPLCPGEARLVPAAIHDGDPSWCEYLGAVKRGTFCIERASTAAEEDYVKARQEDKSICADDLRRWLTLARATGLCWGLTELTSEVWQYVLALEATRRTRCAQEEGGLGVAPTS